MDSFRDSIYTPENVDKLVEDARAINANVLIVQVGRWMDCFCNRSSFPRTHVPIDADFDPLDDVIEKAHAAGIEVHAWVNATPAWNLATPPENPEHIFHTNGHDVDGWDNWLNVRVDGEQTVGANLRNIDPANPAAVDYVVEGIASIVREYDVDGINLDYIRYPDGNTANYQSDWGYTAASIDRFQAATGRGDIPEPTDAEFSDWRREQVTGFTRKIFLTMYDVDPQAALSINGITYWFGPQTEGGWEATRAYSEVMQDWKAWLEEGIIDVNVAMNYKAETDEGDRIQMYDEWNEVLKDWQADRFSVVGPALYLNTVEDSLRQARRALEPSADGNTVVGWSGYSYATPSNASGSPEQADAERERLAHGLTAEDPSGAEPLFAQPAAVPEMTWKTEPEHGHIAGELITRDGAALDQVSVSATNLRTGAKAAGRVSDGSGWFGFVNLEPGRWLVSIELPRGVVGQPVDVVEVAAGEIVTADFAPLVRPGRP
ncbi:family 10 glycosylhydrolase [Phytoactinopolyspora sp. XMNu-373]|uniref:Family 10 glycosylhydrolase n=1 Tax=Phytoactinopolyspora mesophila TaxID=2650750 RepID=A0A7K3MBP9_9ACTN|nr:family 10 glycosylhydrolase [Phytoactinopolyspora mesophila]